MRTVTVLGAGSWGTALAVHLGRIGHDVRLWARDRALVEDMAARRANAVYLPGVRLPDSVSVTESLEDALEERRARRVGDSVARLPRRHPHRRAVPRRRRRSS